VWDLDLTVEEEMDIAYRGELLTGSECGRMDQACAYGSAPVLLVFDGDVMQVRPLEPGCSFHLLVTDLGSGKDTRRILRDLNAAFAGGEPGIREALGPVNHRIVEQACGALERGDPETLGALMTEAQSVFDSRLAPHCPSELAAPLLHSVLAHPGVDGLTWGGKGVGSQGDGSAQFLCRDARSRDELSQMLEAEAGLSSLALTISPG
jgi:mevalonate kinase